MLKPKLQRILSENSKRKISAQISQVTKCWHKIRTIPHVENILPLLQKPVCPVRVNDAM